MKNILKIVLMLGILSSFSFAGQDLNNLHKGVYQGCKSQLMDEDMPTPVKELVCKCAVNIMKTTVKDDKKAKLLMNIASGNGEFTKREQDIFLTFLTVSVDMCNAFEL